MEDGNRSQSQSLDLDCVRERLCSGVPGDTATTKQSLMEPGPGPAPDFVPPSTSFLRSLLSAWDENLIANASFFL